MIKVERNIFMRYGYLGIFDQKQDYKKLNDAGCEAIYMEQNTERTELKILLKKVKKGDCIVILKTEDLGKTWIALFNNIRRLRKKEVNITCLESNWLDTTQVENAKIIDELLVTQEILRKKK